MVNLIRKDFEKSQEQLKKDFLTADEQLKNDFLTTIEQLNNKIEILTKDVSELKIMTSTFNKTINRETNRFFVGQCRKKEKKIFEY